MTDAAIHLWGREIGAVSWLAEEELGVFQYTPEFATSGIEIAPLTMPLRQEPYQFPSLPRHTFKGLPGLLADSLPDKFGNAIIDTWLATQGRSADSFNPVERLCYVGTRGMGALEFHPTLHDRSRKASRLEIEALTELANRVLDERSGMQGKLAGEGDAEQLEDIIRVGTSAGGARAKAILAWNEATGEFRSGQLPQEQGFTYWLLKFDGVGNNRDKEIADPLGFGLIEYAYYLMAAAAGITMAPSRLHHEGGRAHFMTRRFDRDTNGHKLHMQSLGAMMHYDFNQPGAHSYEQALQTLRRLQVPTADIEEQLRRAVFNVLARNQDDHVKNIAFLMDKKGTWRLSPAFDVAYSYNPDGAWTGQHQMSINGKRDDFLREDLVALGAVGNIKPARANTLIDEVAAGVNDWAGYARESGIDDDTIKRIGKAHRRL